MPILNLVIFIDLVTILFLLFYFTRTHQEKKNNTPPLPTLSANELSLIDDAKIRINLIEQAYKEEANMLISQLHGMIIQTTDDLAKESKKTNISLQNTTTKQVEEAIKTFQQNLTTLFQQEEEKMRTQRETDLAAAKTAIENYKKDRMAAIDKDIIAMLEKTVRLVLSKKLSLQDHVDLIYESLEKAKAEKFIS